MNPPQGKPISYCLLEATLGRLFALQEMRLRRMQRNLFRYQSSGRIKKKVHFEASENTSVNPVFTNINKTTPRVPTAPFIQRGACNPTPNGFSAVMGSVPTSSRLLGHSAHQATIFRYASVASPLGCPGR
ncbi:hypothetical protein FOYG_07803 [Fusarium oxysporum NRRL 32931]|uniref:Uncharacterized protein n=1 Tax=Fusarium oxysporum NRRL 32931 TaxID=660029 RepID=W9IA89_FUSOX|nr:hypothetical protein FOYG_07803 [Fusarium oxysporum NRRL 32931]EWY90211.1 hypothetical protein FOYG_07803 [Fusarium oxysporum NRRL 32931]EWY90212.1 hypothetical protein FOYG_07803 [Fusarium oxysporum NRRL 32931]EWY90213.1 hypothetical protein FOYG_07803 [Fusarium oxysporum NRRL 32931]